MLPTEERVEAMLAGTSRSPDEVVGKHRPTVGMEVWESTVEKVAVNAVIAGAAPEHFPVILALCASGDTGRQSSMSSMGNMVVVNGPIRNEIGMNSGIGAMGPYNFANSAIGRAFGLASQNLQGGSVPGLSYGGSQGSNLSYNCCTFAENEERSPFPPYHVFRGHQPEESTVAVFYVWGNVWSEHLREHWQEKLVAMMSGLEPLEGALFVLDPIVAREFCAKGLDSQEKIAQWVFDNVRIPAAPLLGPHHAEHGARAGRGRRRAVGEPVEGRARRADPAFPAVRRQRRRRRGRDERALQYLPGGTDAAGVPLRSQRAARVPDRPVALMATAVATRLTVLDPRGYPPKVDARGMAPALETLQGKRLFLVDVGFENSDEFMRQLHGWLAEHEPGIRTEVVRMRDQHQPDPELYGRIAAEGDAAIIGVGT